MLGCCVQNRTFSVRMYAIKLLTKDGHAHEDPVTARAHTELQQRVHPEVGRPEDGERRRHLQHGRQHQALPTAYTGNTDT